MSRMPPVHTNTNWWARGCTRPACRCPTITIPNRVHILFPCPLACSHQIINNSSSNAILLPIWKSPHLPKGPQSVRSVTAPLIVVSWRPKKLRTSGWQRDVWSMIGRSRSHGTRWRIRPGRRGMSEAQVRPPMQLPDPRVDEPCRSRWTSKGVAVQGVLGMLARRCLRRSPQTGHPIRQAPSEPLAWQHTCSL